MPLYEMITAHDLCENPEPIQEVMSFLAGVTACREEHGTLEYRKQELGAPKGTFLMIWTFTATSVPFEDSVESVLVEFCEDWLQRRRLIAMWRRVRE